MLESLRHKIKKLKQIIKKPSVKASKEVKQLLKLVAKVEAKFDLVSPTTWQEKYAKLLNSEFVQKLQDGDESFLYFACFAIVCWLKPDDEILEEVIQLVKKLIRLLFNIGKI